MNRIAVAKSTLNEPLRFFNEFFSQDSIAEAKKRFYPILSDEADHVQSHSSGGTNKVDNFLASFKTHNNYRWHLADEFQWIFSLVFGRGRKSPMTQN